MLLVLVHILACRGSDGDTAAPPPFASGTLPGLVPLDIHLGSSQPYALAAIAALPGPRLAINDGEESPYVRVYDTTGTVVARFGREGSGPGELRGWSPMWASGDTLTIYDQRRQAVVRYHASGTLIDEAAIRGVEFPYWVLGDSIDATSDFVTPNAPRPPLLRRALDDTTGRHLLGIDDSIFALGAGRARYTRDPAGAWLPTPARNYFGDGWTYTIGIYAPSGARVAVLHRDLLPNVRSPRRLAETRRSLELANRPSPGPNGKFRPPSPTIQARLDTLERETIRHFEWGMLRVDGRGRLWVFGESGDGTFADVIADTTFLGRHQLDCRLPRQRIAMGNDWFTLQCRPEAPEEDNPYRIQAYRIIER
jgi:hypothetical protein